MKSRIGSTLKLALATAVASAAVSSASARTTPEAPLPATGKTCHFECADGTHACSDFKELMSVCEEAPLFTDKSMADFISSLDLVGKPFGDVPARLLPLNFSCNREYRRTGHDMGCTRTISLPHCMMQMQWVWLNLRELDHGEPRPVPDDEAIDISQETPFSAMHVSRITSQTGATGDDLCRGGK